MIKFRNPRIAALAAAATLGVGAIAVPSAAIAASHTSKTKVVSTTQSSSRDRSPHDPQSADKGQSVDPSGSSKDSLDY